MRADVEKNKHTYTNTLINRRQRRRRPGGGKARIKCFVALQQTATATMQVMRRQKEIDARARGSAAGKRQHQHTVTHSHRHTYSHVRDSKQVDELYGIGGRRRMSSKTKQFVSGAFVRSYTELTFICCRYVYLVAYVHRLGMCMFLLHLDLLNIPLVLILYIASFRTVHTHAHTLAAAVVVYSLWTRREVNANERQTVVYPASVKNWMRMNQHGEEEFYKTRNEERKRTGTERTNQADKSGQPKKLTQPVLASGRARETKNQRTGPRESGKSSFCRTPRGMDWQLERVFVCMYIPTYMRRWDWPLTTSYTRTRTYVCGICTRTEHKLREGAVHSKYSGLCMYICEWEWAALTKRAAKETAAMKSEKKKHERRTKRSRGARKRATKSGSSGNRATGRGVTCTI